LPFPAHRRGVNQREASVFTYRSVTATADAVVM